MDTDQNIVACMLVDRGFTASDQTWLDAETLLNGAKKGVFKGDPEMRRFLKIVARKQALADDPKGAGWEMLVDTVCDTFQVEKYLVLGRHRGHKATAAKNLIATLWSEHHSLQETADMLGWRNHTNVYHARRQVAKMFACERNGVKIRKAITRIKEEMPELLERIEK